ncbi:ABC transporter ATP-binding protein [Halorarum salinum]|uniref:ABC transporter ATP-binding protein n=1 Tax=Halorarum salinum TaxID=2743089 RepID=A0A7D5QCX1_9EURY|nr:ABC transporter ATP-binding protein [Halobaculum salinum]QLG62900.1 ABC transporter ATP-binding protein [Halobaculum salinum]
MSADDASVFDVYRDRVSRPLHRLFTEYGTDEWRWLVLGMTANVVARAASLLPPVVLGAAIDSSFQGDDPYALPLVPASLLPTDAPDAEQFWFSAALIVGAFLVTAVLTWVYGVAANNFAHSVMHAVRTDSYAKMQDLDMWFFDGKQTGEVMSVLNNDATNLERFLDDALQNSVRIGVMLVGIGIVLFLENAQLAALTLVAVPAMVGFTYWFMKAVEPRYAAQREAVADLNTRLENALGGIRLVKSTGSEAYETDRVRRSSLAYYRRTLSMLRLNYVYRPGMELLAGVSFAVTFVVGGIWLIGGTAPGPLSGDLTAGAFVTFLFLSQRFVTPLAEVSNIVSQYENAKASCERVFGLQDVPRRVTDEPDALELDDVEGAVEYDGVSFRYADGDPADAGSTPVEPARADGGSPEDGPSEGGPREDGRTDGGDDWILRDVDFAVEPGETVALVGPTGAGKSTLLKLLLRLYDVNRGAVRVDGHDVREVTARSLRRSVGYVSQDTFLFDGTVAENVLYGTFGSAGARGGNGEVAEVQGDVEAAAKAAEAHEFIRNLPEAYDTEVGERGVKLSGGQRQRLSIARTVLQDPDVLVLDEATSAVDTETELLIQRSLDRLAADRTTFVIAHRLSTVKDADEILVLEGGEVVERGVHEELLSADGLYAKLWGVQAGEIESLPESFVQRARERQAETVPPNEDD